MQDLIIPNGGVMAMDVFLQLLQGISCTAAGRIPAAFIEPLKLQHVCALVHGET